MAYENANIETIARGVCVKDNHLLVCLPARGGRAYLPGGHIEFGEPAQVALEREILEEMGLVANAGRFLAVSENRFEQKGETHCEINLVFALDIPKIAPPVDPPATESWIRFAWVPLTQEALAAVNLLPAHLIVDLPRWLATPGCHRVDYHVDPTVMLA
jgi:ADP-ribose pyrophosphatase YjhB (NUDIX family)